MSNKNRLKQAWLTALYNAPYDDEIMTEKEMEELKIKLDQLRKERVKLISHDDVKKLT